MKVLPLSLLTLLLAFTAAVSAQGTPVPATNDTETTETTDLTIDDLTEDEPMKDKSFKKSGKSNIELGLRPTYMFVGGDVDADAGYGIGLHLRKSLDHLFSLRLDGLFGQASGETMSNALPRRFENNWLSGTGYMVVTLNNFRFSGDTRSTNFYVMAGAGASSFEVEYLDPEIGSWNEGRNPILEREFAAHAAVGAGIAFRVSPRFNVGVEYQALVPFGDRADLIDGYNETTDPTLGGNFRDIMNAASLSLNFNIGKGPEPRYWTNAFAPMRDELDRVGSKVDAATRDSDGDGVVDAVDQEANTPAGVPVDTRGRVLDSDKDGIADYKDLEPFFPPRAGEEVDANGVVMNRADKPVTEDRVQEMIDASLERYKAENGNSQGGTTTVRTVNGEVYLPMVYFPLGQSRVKYSDYGILSSVARVIQGNPGMKMVIRGYTDRVGNAANNEVLSYRRAQAVIDHLVTQHGISRDMLILQFRGEDNAIVPLDKSYINRRVEFLTAEPTDQEDAAPAGANGRGGF
ncbi:MAG: OmpA family protein [Bacteroidota bacterium]